MSRLRVMTNEHDEISGLSIEPEAAPSSAGSAEEELVWHYTRHASLELIIQSHTLWAGGIHGLNDREELHIGIRRVKQAFKKLRREWDYQDSANPEIDFDDLKEALGSAAYEAFDGSAFVICFTPAGDDTPQWQKYALADGFAIAVPKGVRFPVVGSEPPPGVRRFGYIEEFPFRWIPLLYKKKAQVAAAQEGLGQLIRERAEADYVAAIHDDMPSLASIFRDRAVSGYVDAVASVKHKAFRSEREIRYVVSRPSNPAAVQPTPPDREHVVVTGASNDPFDLDWTQHDPDYYQSLPSLLPIREIRIGPGNNFKATEAWLRTLLDAHGYSAVKIRKSTSPLK